MKKPFLKFFTLASWWLVLLFSCKKYDQAEFKKKTSLENGREVNKLSADSVDTVQKRAEKIPVIPGGGGSDRIHLVNDSLYVTGTRDLYKVIIGNVENWSNASYNAVPIHYTRVVKGVEREIIDFVRVADGSIHALLRESRLENGRHNLYAGIIKPDGSIITSENIIGYNNASLSLDFSGNFTWFNSIFKVARYDWRNAIGKFWTNHIQTTNALFPWTYF